MRRQPSAFFDQDVLDAITTGSTTRAALIETLFAPSRRVDDALQRLRKAGRIAYGRSRGWYRRP
jgi:hypothetical protein